MNTRILYLSYTGLLEPLGQSQVLAYQEHLAADHGVHIVSFERAEDLADGDKLAAVRERLQRAGIAWHPLRYHKRWSLLSTAWDIAAGTWAGWRIARREGIGIVHARSYVPAVMGALIKRLAGAKLLFDMRGFWVDERVDGGLWRRDGSLFRAGKRVERWLLRSADHVVSLTHAGVREMNAFPYLQDRRPPMTVIPTCADLDRFRPQLVRPERPFTLGYVGSVGTWYLFDEALLAFRALLARRPGARLLVVNRGAHAHVRSRAAAHGIPDAALELREASHAEVPVQMARMDAGVFFIKPMFSKQASAPTKLGEFLGCGIPCLSNEGVGDMAQILRGDRCGVAIEGFDADTLEAGVEALLALCADPGTPARCVASAARHFSLEEGVRRYREVYRALAGGTA